MTRSIATGAALALASTLLTLAVLELGARVVTAPVALRMTMYRPAPEVGYELVPGWEGRGPLHEWVTIDADGLRGPPSGRLDAAHPGTLRVVAFGDSFTFGLGVDAHDAFPAALGRALAPLVDGRHPGTHARAVEVSNAGVPGYNLFQESRAIATRAAALSPDLIVLGFVENDVYNPDGSDVVADAAGALVPRPGAFAARVTLNPFAALSGPWLWLQLHSATFRWASMQAIARGLAVHGDADLAALARRAVQDTDLPTKLLRGEDDPSTAPLWSAAARELQSAAATARRLGVPLVLVLLPRPEQLFAPELRGGFKRIADTAALIGIPVVDPTPLLAAEPDRVGLYLFPADHHPSARGYARIAAIAARQLADAHLLPIDSPDPSGEKGSRSDRSRAREAS